MTCSFLLFFLLCDVCIFQSINCLLVSGSIIKVSPHVTAFSNTSIFFYDSFHDVRANDFFFVFLFLIDVFRDHFCTEFPHVQLVMQDSSYCLLSVLIISIMIRMLKHRSCYRLSPSCTSFWSSMKRLLHSETELRDIITVYFLQQLETFCLSIFRIRKTF